MVRDPQVGAQSSLSYAQAVSEALRRVLAEHPRCTVFGGDKHEAGGNADAIRTLQEAFGHRVVCTPPGESATLGAAIDAVIDGLRPVVEIEWSAVTPAAMDRIVDQKKTTRRLATPLVIRTQHGESSGAGQVQNLEALLAHAPGLQVGLVSTAQDAYSMLLAAAGGEDPVLLIESGALYHRAAEPVTVGGAVDSVGGARVRREGIDLTLLCWGAMQFQVIEAAQVLAAEGISVEVIDARWLNPFDWDSLFASVRKTRKLAIVHEANVIRGFSAEIAVRVQEELFHTIEQPVACLSLGNVATSDTSQIQRALSSNVQTLVNRARSLARVM